MASHPARILVIDDEKVVCISCVRILEEEGHSVDFALGAREGVERAVEGGYDLVLIDLKMPELSGQEALAQIKERRPDIVAVMITGYATIQTSIECVKKGAFDYIPKPFTPEELALSVEKALEQRALLRENAHLREELGRSQTLGRLIGCSDAMEELRRQILKVAPSEFNVMIVGESGTGKELIADAIHQNSSRAGQPFLAVDLSALSPNLVESELFGHKKGSFTGATQDRPGTFVAAHGGTLFLDEISNVDLHLQGKLLRALESRRIHPVGGDEDLPVDIRLITATNKDLAKLVERGEFREDLYYRIHVIPIVIPPLRERTDDIPALASKFLKDTRLGASSQVRGFTTEAMAKLIAYRWPGNVRELKHMVERLVATVDAELIGLAHLPPEIAGAQNVLPQGRVEVPANAEELKEAKRRLKELVYSQVEKQFLFKALEDAGWNISRAAAAVGMQRPNFHALMRKYGITSDDRG
jgi:two-component system NtrC family response regulator